MQCASAGVQGLHLMPLAGSLEPPWPHKQLVAAQIFMTLTLRALQSVKVLPGTAVSHQTQHQEDL